MTMKENQNATFYDSKSFGREADPLAFGTKEIYQLNDITRNTNPFLFEVNGGDDCWNPKFVDDFSMDNQNGSRDSTRKEFQGGLFRHPSSLEEDVGSLSSYTNAKDKLQSSTTVEEFTHGNDNESRDSRRLHIAASDLCETDANLFTDKNILEFEQPELMVCYKEINYHVVKDICVDEGMPVNRKFLIESSRDDQSGNYFPQPLNDDSHFEATEGAVDMGLAASSLNNMKGVSANEHESKEEIRGKLLAQERSKSLSEISLEEDTGPENSVQKDETNFGATSKTVNVASEEVPFMDRTLPIQEFGTRSFLRSFLNSLDGEGNKVAQLPDQISSGKAVSGGPAASLAGSGSQEDKQTNNLSYNSKVESGSITFNFNSMAPVATGVTNGKTEHVKEQPADLRDVFDQEDADTDDLSDTRRVHSNNIKDTSVGTAHEQSQHALSDDFSATSQANYVSNKDTSNENLHLQSPDHDNENPDNISSDGQPQFASSKRANSMNGDSVGSQGRHDEGETSFSAAGLITYSGPIAYSGSLSLRSDASTTSGRSFAFPILQSEWNSSPVRMAKADGRHFRKHKCWRSGLLCCRF